MKPIFLFGSFILGTCTMSLWVDYLSYLRLKRQISNEGSRMDSIQRTIEAEKRFAKLSRFA